MKALLREALEAGAAGFSTGRTDNHRTAEGKWTPSADAPAEELEALAGAFAGLGHGVLQAVSDFDMARNPERFDAEWSVLERFAAAAGGHPLSTTLLERDAAPDQWRRILARAEQAHAAEQGLAAREIERARACRSVEGEAVLRRAERLVVGQWAWLERPEPDLPLRSRSRRLA